MPPARDAQIAEQRKWANAQPWHSLDWRQVAQFTGTDAARGLPDAEVASRVARFGPNELFGDTGPSWWKVLLGNIFNAMNAVLTIAMVMSFVVKDYVSWNRVLGDAARALDVPCESFRPQWTAHLSNPEIMKLDSDVIITFFVPYFFHLLVSPLVVFIRHFALAAAGWPLPAAPHSPSQPRSSSS